MTPAREPGGADGDLCEGTRRSRLGIVLYDDGRVACDEDWLIIRWYYPWGAAKRIPYPAIRSVTKRPLSRGTGGWRIWGSGDFVHWWNLDPGRPGKSTALEIDIGHRIRPTISPDDPERVYALLEERAVS